MPPQVHFEQLSEELRRAHPQAQTVWATESPLTFQVDGSPVQLNGFLASHRPTWLSADPTQIPADGVTPTIVKILSPMLANQAVSLRFTQHAQIWVEDLVLDTNGNGEIELVAETSGEIRIELDEFPVRLTIRAIPAEGGGL